MHRRTRIERTSGLRESAIHALMMTEISVPLLLTLLCEVNPLLLGISTVAAVLIPFRSLFRSGALPTHAGRCEHDSSAARRAVRGRLGR
jgi:hypothetical protein